MLTSGMPSVESSVTTRCDAWPERPMPPPSTNPFMIAMNGFT